jgi:hypothetical protein
MIGRIRFVFQGAIAEAVLEDGGCWTCTVAPCLVRPLEIRCGPNWEDRPPGHRHLAGAARWLRGTIVSGPLRDSPRGAATAARRASNFAEPALRRSPDLAALRSDRITERIAAGMCSVGVGMIRLWVDTGAWPMPHCGCAAPPTFSLSEVKGWLATGTWPAGAHFRALV